MLVKTIEAFKRHVTASSQFSYNLIAPYLRTKDRQYIRPLLGRELYALWSDQSPTDGVQKEAFDLFEEASSNLAMLDYTHVGIIHISDSGFHISTNADSTPATWWQLKDLRRKLLNSGTRAIDEALEIMEEHEDQFPFWVTSPGYTTFKELFVRHTSDFQRYYNIDNSRLTFLRLRPHLLKVEDKYFEASIGMETANKIKTGSDSIERQALKLAQAAQVNLCLSELAHEGAFSITPNGIVITSDEIPGEKYNRLSDQELHNFSRIKLTDGNEYLRKLIRHLEAHPDVFVEYKNKTASAISNPIHDTKSIVSF